MALLSVACGGLAAAWLRDFGGGSLSAPLIGWFLCALCLALVIFADGVYPRELKTVPHLHGIAARNPVLLGIKMVGNRVITDCPVPQRWDLFRIAGHMGQVHLIREGQQWKVDAVATWQA